jgi:hypothetical protein
MPAQNLNVKILRKLNSWTYTVTGRDEKVTSTKEPFDGTEESRASFEHSWNLVMYFEERKYITNFKYFV